MYVRIGLHIRWHKSTRIYASGHTYIRIELHVRTHEPARIYVIVSGSVIFCAGIGFANTLGDDILLGVEVTTSAHRHPPKPDSPPTAYLDEFDKLGPSKMPLLPLYHGGRPFTGGAGPFHHPAGRAGAYR